MKAQQISEHISRLAAKVLQGTATPEERAFLEKYEAFLDRGESAVERMPDEARQELEKVILERIVEDIHNPAAGSPLTRTRWLPAAAAAILILFGVWWVLARSGSTTGADTREELTQDIRPGGNKAVLTLGNGQRVELDNLAEGGVAREGAVEVQKQADGLIAYQPLHAESVVEPVFHELSTPRGGVFRMELPDGTQVWLNSETRIRYSVGYVEGKRLVELSGEAYFDVKKDTRHPFLVRVGERMQVEVTGTQFNVNAYPDETRLETSLVEGSVRVRSSGTGKDAVSLSPGQQAALERGNEKLTVQRVDVAEVTAWQKGLFLFRSADAAMVLRQISRWYDVEVVYRNGIPEGHITGKIPRYKNASEVLEILKLSGINVKIEGGKLIVM